MWLAQLTATALSQPRLADPFTLGRACFSLSKSLLVGFHPALLQGSEHTTSPKLPGEDEGRAGAGGKGGEAGEVGSKPRSSHLEKALAALTRPYPVVLAGGIISTDGAGAFPRRGAPAGRRWEATAAAATALTHQGGGGCIEAER